MQQRLGGDEDNSWDYPVLVAPSPGMHFTLPDANTISEPGGQVVGPMQQSSGTCWRHALILPALATFPSHWKLSCCVFLFGACRCGC